MVLYALWIMCNDVHVVWKGIQIALGHMPNKCIQMYKQNHLNTYNGVQVDIQYI